MYKNSEGLQESSDQLDTVAAEWVARVDRGPLDPEGAQKLAQWLATSSRHRGAHARAQAALAYLDYNAVQTLNQEAITSFFMARDAGGKQAVRGVSRRRLLWLGGGIATAAAASVSALMLKPSVPVVTYSARRGEILKVPLSDGTLVTLDTASTIAVRYLQHAREVQLVEGRALFDVAKDKARPFTVSTRGLQVRAVGTSFVVRNTQARAPEVLVYEGIVDVGAHIDTVPVRVGADMRVIASISGPALNVMSVDPTELSHELAWQQGLFEIEDVSLAMMAEEYVRYSDMRIVIPDRKVAELTITGRFFATNPIGFANAAAASFGLKVDVNGQEIRLLRL